jgi:hypothetical protein
MTPKKAFTTGALLLLCAAGHAEFEGVIVMRGSGSEGASEARLMVSPAGVRREADSRAKDGELRTVTTLFLFSKPDVVYGIDHASKTYVEAPKNQRPPQKTPAATIQKLGQEKIAGYLCERVKISSAGFETERWISKDILEPRTLALMTSGQASPDSLEVKLREAGLQGLPLKLVHRADGKTLSSMEAISIESKKLPADLFKVPAGYAKRLPNRRGSPPKDPRKN